MSHRVDALVAGAGIYGAAVAYEAVRRGASVLLVDRGDIAGGATSNSLKLAYAGFRRLESLELGQFFESVRERRRWLREASPWVRPARLMMDTSGRGLADRLRFRAGLSVYDLLSIHRNRGVSDARRLPRSSYPAWWDAVFDDPERIVFALLRSCAAGPGTLEVLPYCGVTQTLRRGSQTVGAILADGRRVESDHVFRCVGAQGSAEHPVLAMNLVLPPLPLGTGLDGVALAHPDDGRDVFALAWRGHTLVGTWTRHYPVEAAGPFRLYSEWVVEMLRWLSPVHPSFRNLTRADVRRVHAGLLPRAPRAVGPVPASNRRIETGEGVTDVVGVSWTEAWVAAEEAVGRVLGELSDRQARVRVPLSTLAPPGPSEGEDALRFAVESEWATGLEDALLRRLPVAATGHPGIRVAEAASVLLQPMLDWSEEERREQVESFHELPQFLGNVPG